MFEVIGIVFIFIASVISLLSGVAQWVVLDAFGNGSKFERLIPIVFVSCGVYGIYYIFTEAITIGVSN